MAILDVFFAWIFTLEMILKLIGVGLRNYIRDKFNLFDAIIVIISLVDFTIVVAGQFDDGHDNAILSSLRALRLLRVVKLTRQWTELQNILKALVDSLKEISSFSLLLFLVMFIKALLGMEMFAYSVCWDINGEMILGRRNIQKAFDDGMELTWPRENFNDAWSALVTIFILIMAEDWN